jgi:uncharacterized protein YPO0396
VQLSERQFVDTGPAYEKDDRHSIDDRSRYVLGWNNDAKIAVLEAKRRQPESHLGEVGGRIDRIDAERKGLQARLDALTRLEEFTNFKKSTGLAWPPTSRRSKTSVQD